MKKLLSIIASLSYILSGCSSVETNIKKNDKPKVDPEFIATYSRLSGRAAVCVEFGYPQYKADNIINAGVSVAFTTEILRYPSIMNRWQIKLSLKRFVKS
ncbi:TPA: hypothetical protein NG586_004749 [Vibrio parahaemolyticus]|nr:hypothetical protein [Vibrio parahaemolyticus]HCE3330560.1 hypothetical protein [Vibrio parahaemolyticus]